MNSMGKVANATVMAETTAEAKALAGRGRFWAGLLGAGLLIGLTGPFGTFDALPIVSRIAYWVFVVPATFWLGYLVSFAVATRAEGSGFRALQGLAAGALIAGLFVTVWLAGFHWLVFATPFLAEAGRLLPYVVIICVIVAAMSEVAATGDISPVPRATPDTVPNWLDQLPGHLGRKLLLLHAQDHYVQAGTEFGETLIRTTLHDAARELGDYGVRCHRSWWVARDAIAAYRYRDGAPVIVLHDGRALPVGRTYRRAVKDALR